MSAVIDWAALRPDHPALANLPAALRQAAKRTALKRGEYVFRVGASVRTMLYLLSGEVRLVRQSHEGAEIILQRTRGGFFAEASLESGGYHCDAVAADDGDLLRFPARAFREALVNDAAFRNAWIAHLAREVRRLRTQCERLNLKSAEARVIHYLETEGQSGEGIHVPSRKAWAAELGLSHEALYRTLARLRKAGSITIADKVIGPQR